MIVHSDSDLGFLLALLVGLAVIMTLLFSAMFAFERRFRTALKVAGAALGLIALLPILVGVVSWLTPQTIVKVGDGYCEDIRCIGIDKVRAESKGPETIYDLDVHLFSDANTVNRACW